MSSRVSAATFGLILVPLVTSATAAPEAVAGQSGSSPAAAIELHDGAADNTLDCAPPDEACDSGSDIAKERAYLVETSRPGGTMVRQGPDVAIGRLHPEFVGRLAGAIREAREKGIPDAGIFSAYRPPAFGVGGFKDKFRSLHAYGLAVDMYGIGAPGSSQAKLWTRIAAKHGVACPYGVNNPIEWNHCQPTRVKVVRPDSPLVKTIAPHGPLSPASMFEAGGRLIEGVAKLFAAFGGAPASSANDDNTVARSSHRVRRLRTADMQSSRQHRHVRLTPVKGHRKKVTRSASGRHRVVRHTGHRHGSISRRAQKAS